MLPAVTDRLVIALAALHLESEFLLAALVRHHVGQHAGAADGGRPDGQLAFIIDQQNAVKSEWLAGLDGQTFNFQRVARGHTILFASGF